MINKKFIAFLISCALMICPAVPFSDLSVLYASAAYEGSENPCNKQDNQIVQYDGRRWVQPPQWNCPTVNPRDYEGGIMIHFDKIGLDPNYTRGKVQRVYVSVHGATDPVSMMKFHIFYDTRLKIAKNSNDEFLTPGKALPDFKSTGSAMVKEGELAFYAYSDYDIELEDGSLFTIDFIIPEDAKAGDVYPIGMSYVDDGIVCDLFINSARDEAGKLQMTYVFSKGIYNGYIMMLDDLSIYRPDSSSSASSSMSESSKADTSSKAASSSRVKENSSSKAASSSRVKENSSSKAASSSRVKESSSSKRESSSKRADSSSKAKEKKPMKGDANLDGKVDVADIAVTAAHIKGIKALSGEGLRNANVNADKEINVTDIAVIASHIKGIKAINQTEG